MGVERCSNCGSQPGPGVSCAACGHVLAAPSAEAPWVEQNWEIVVRPDRAYYEMLEPDGMAFPEETYSRRVPLIGDLMSIGRRSKTHALQPEIDLSGSLEDVGVSHRHAVLMRQPEGSWALVDQDSTNGTYVNADHEPVAPNQPVPLSDGDQIHLGAWTTLSMERLNPAQVLQGQPDGRPSMATRHLARARRRMEIDLLGPLRLRVQGEDVPIGAPMKRAVLAVLALRVGSPVSALDLEWALWGEDVPKTAAAALRGYVHELRQLLPDDAIETTNPLGYKLNASEEWIDTSRFERRCARGRALLASGHPGSAVAELMNALELWRGEPLLDLSNGPVGSIEAVRLNEQKLDAEEDLFEGRLLLGDHQSVAADLWPAVEAAPTRQRRWAQLMLALYRCGRSLEATRAFQRLRSELDENYGLEPSAELIALENGIVMNHSELQWSPPVAEPQVAAATQTDPGRATSQ